MPRCSSILVAQYITRASGKYIVEALNHGHHQRKHFAITYSEVSLTQAASSGTFLVGVHSTV